MEGVRDDDHAFDSVCAKDRSCVSEILAGCRGLGFAQKPRLWDPKPANITSENGGGVSSVTFSGKQDAVDSSLQEELSGSPGALAGITAGDERKVSLSIIRESVLGSE